MKFGLVLPIATSLALAAPAFADPVTSVRALPTGLELHTNSGTLTVEPWSNSIVHVRFGPIGYRGNYNPSVIAAPERVRFNIRQTADAYVLLTAKLSARISKSTAAISFTDNRGNILLQEAERSSETGRSGRSPRDVPVYGLGQHQNGLLDYSGSTVHLQQKNGDVAVPMMLSPAGFGILWNNASVMDVDVGQAGAKFPLVIRNEAGPGIDYDFILGSGARPGDRRLSLADRRRAVDAALELGLLAIARALRDGRSGARRRARLSRDGRSDRRRGDRLAALAAGRMGRDEVRSGALARPRIIRRADARDARASSNIGLGSL